MINNTTSPLPLHGLTSSKKGNTPGISYTQWKEQITRSQKNYPTTGRIPARFPEMTYRLLKEQKAKSQKAIQIRVNPKKHYNTNSNCHMYSDRSITDYGADPVEKRQKSYIEDLS